MNKRATIYQLTAYLCLACVCFLFFFEISAVTAGASRVSSSLSGQFVALLLLIGLCVFHLAERQGDSKNQPRFAKVLFVSVGMGIGFFMLVLLISAYAYSHTAPADIGAYVIHLVVLGTAITYPLVKRYLR